MSHNGVLHILRRVLMLLGVRKVRFYNLHRTFVTLTLQSGVDMKTASGILGRYSAGFTLDTYPYVTTAAQKEAAKTMKTRKKITFGIQCVASQLKMSAVTVPCPKRLVMTMMIVIGNV